MGINLKERNVGAKDKSPIQGQTSAKFPTSNVLLEGATPLS